MDYLTYTWTKRGITILYHLLAHHEIFRAKVGKVGINSKKHLLMWSYCSNTMKDYS